jgi:hypothetical protein
MNTSVSDSSQKHAVSGIEAVLCAAGILLLVATGAGDVVLRRGMSDPIGLAAAAERLNQLPATIGAWESTPETTDLREIRMAQVAGSVRRNYRHRETGQAVTLTILCGASGPMSVHPPTACFEGVGYSLTSGPTVVQFTDSARQESSLNRASFRLPESTTEEVVRVFWGWSQDGQWQVPVNPRMTFRGLPVLYKLYVVDRAFDLTDDVSQSESFLRDSLPAIRETLQRP